MQIQWSSSSIDLKAEYKERYHNLCLIDTEAQRE